jgi:omega-amidase
MNDLRVTLIQADTLWHDAAANQALYGALARSVAGQSDLIVLPETLLSGFSNDVTAQAQSMSGTGVAWMRELAADCGAVVTGSLVISEQGQVFNRLIWMRPDGRHAHYDKRHLFRMANEHERYAAGSQKLIVEIAGWRICPLVCYDLRFPVFIRNRFAQQDAAQRDYDALIFVANWPAARAHAWKTLLRARAIENLSYCVGVNRTGTDGNGLAYSGDSAALDFLGQTLVECGAQAQVVSTTLSWAALQAHRTRFPAYLDADDFVLR